MDVIPLLVVAIAVGIATITDIRSFKVHNWLTVTFFLSGLAYHTFQAGLPGLGESALSGIVIVSVLLLPFTLGVLGAGDVKLLAGLACWLGLPLSFRIAAIGFLATGIYSLARLTLEGRLGDTWLNARLAAYRLQMMARHLSAENHYESVHELAQSPVGRRRLVPFSAMLAFGVLISFLWLSLVL